ncbi:MAG: leucine zipper domain-containing protein [Guyparkeria sp.]|uniref:leucine zipper domain-containing protein n=1 Tax=Guyparkeria sp. TaxID=2035736 RepID=UPI00397C6FB7
MNLHQKAHLTPRGRELLVKRVIIDGLLPIGAVQAVGVSPPIAYNWLRRYRQTGWFGLQNRSSQSRYSPRSTPDRLIEEIIERRKAPQACRQIA